MARGLKPIVDLIRMDSGHRRDSVCGVHRSTEGGPGFRLEASSAWGNLVQSEAGWQSTTTVLLRGVPPETADGAQTENRATSGSKSKADSVHPCFRGYKQIIRRFGPCHAHRFGCTACPLAANIPCRTRLSTTEQSRICGQSNTRHRRDSESRKLSTETSPPCRFLVEGLRVTTAPNSRER